ncbi:MAG TPA: hypothetical protein VF652_09795 [Allosphingosinicella sp.]
MNRLFYLAVPLSLGAAAIAAQPQTSLKGASAPPASPTVLADGKCSIDIRAIRGRYPILSDFLGETAFDGSQVVFASPAAAVQYYLSDVRKVSALVRHGRKALADGKQPDRFDEKAMRQALKEERKALKAETQAFNQEFKKSDPCRQVAWRAIGADSASDQAIDAASSAVDAVPAES